MNHILSSFVLAAGIAVAQTAPCISLNDATNSVGTSVTAFGFAGPGVLAYRFTPATSTLLMAAEISTASSLNHQGYMTLEIYDESALSLPGTRLGGGTWQTQTAGLGLDWQGASFDALVTLSAGTNYWLVWRESGGNRLPYEPAGTTTTVARLSNGNWILQATAQALKWRGYCNLLDAAGVQPIGFGCASTAGRVPAAFTNYLPNATSGTASFQFEASGFLPGSLGLAILGANPAFTSFPLAIAPAGCFLHSDATVVNTVVIGTGNQQAQHAVGANGHAWADLPIPTDPALVGAVIDAQFAGLDVLSGAPLPFVFSNGVRITLS